MVRLEEDDYRDQYHDGREQRAKEHFRGLGIWFRHNTNQTHEKKMSNEEKYHPRFQPGDKVKVWSDAITKKNDLDVGTIKGDLKRAGSGGKDRHGLPLWVATVELPDGEVTKLVKRP